MRFIIALFLISHIAQAQVSKFTPEIIVKYKFSYRPYINEETKITNVMCLISKGDVSYFLDEKMIDLDHQMNSLGTSAKTFDAATQAQLANISKPKIRGIIKKDLHKNVIQSNRIISKNYYFYEEQLNLKWSINNETRKISGYNVQKASCSYKGRNYIAWFTTQITITDGPYKFCGLPGLIVKLHDDKMDYSYEVIEIKKATQNDEVFFHLFVNPIKVNKSEFVALNKAAAGNVLGSIESNPNIVMSEENKKKLLENTKRNETRKLNPMELED